MDIYESKFAKFMQKVSRDKSKNFGVTLDEDCTCWTCKKEEITPEHLAHEHGGHQKQIKRMKDKWKKPFRFIGLIQFHISYQWMLLFKSYETSPWEVEAENIEAVERQKNEGK